MLFHRVFSCVFSRLIGEQEDLVSVEGALTSTFWRLSLWEGYVTIPLLSRSRLMGKKRERTDPEKVFANWNKTLGLLERNEYSVAIVRAAVTVELAANIVI